MVELPGETCVPISAALAGRDCPHRLDLEKLGEQPLGDDATHTQKATTGGAVSGTTAGTPARRARPQVAGSSKGWDSASIALQGV